MVRVCGSSLCCGFEHCQSVRLEKLWEHDIEGICRVQRRFSAGIQKLNKQTTCVLKSLRGNDARKSVGIGNYRSGLFNVADAQLVYCRSVTTDDYRSDNNAQEDSVKTARR